MPANSFAVRSGDVDSPMARAVSLALATVEAGRGGPFGCVIVKDGSVVGEGANEVLGRSDPTAHAEVLAIRDACRRLGSPHLDGCILYTTCEPCAMCVGAIHWARITRVYFALNRTDAAQMGFSDADLFADVARAPEARTIPMLPQNREMAIPLMAVWQSKVDRQGYGPPVSGDG